MLKKSPRSGVLRVLNFSMVFIFIVFIISIGIIDRTITRISIFAEEEQFSLTGKFVFIGIFISSLFVQSLFLCKVYLDIVPIMQKKSKSLYLIPLTFHFLNLLFVIILVTQMIVDDQYAKFLILLIVWNSVIIGILLLSSLIYRLILWIKESVNKNIVVITYSMAIISLILLNTFTLIYFNLGYRIGTEFINSTTIPSVIFSNSYGFIAVMINYVSVLSFFLLCGSTVLLLIRRSEKIKVRHIVMISTSIIVFLSSYLFMWGFSAMRVTNVLLFYDIYSITKIIAFPLGGIFFGFVFWMIARSMKNQNGNNADQYDFRKLKESMYLTAIGIVLILFSAAPLDITRLPYPPFGLVSFTYINIGSLSLFLGIYNLAMSIAGSSQIRKGMHDRSDFMFSIGSSQHSISKRKSISELIGSFRNYILDTKVNEENLDKEYIDEVKNYLQERKTTSNLKSITFTKNESPLGKTWKSWIELWCNWYYCIRKTGSKEDFAEDYGFYSEKELLFVTKANFMENEGKIEYEVSLPGGKILFMPIISNLVTYRQHPEIHSEQDLRLFSKNELDKKNVVFLSINDTEIKDIQQYRIQSDLFNMRSLADSKDIVTETRAISDGYWIFVKPLNLGKNKIFFKIQKRFDQVMPHVTNESEVTEVTFYVNVF